MNKTIGSFGTVVAMTLLWALLWALPGGLIEAIDNVAPAAHPVTRQVDMWMQTLGLPGLTGGLLFSLLLLITDRGRRVADLSSARSGGLGAVSGLLVGVLVVWVMDTGLSDPWQLAVALVVVAAWLGTVSGIASPFVFRQVAQRRASAAS